MAIPRIDELEKLSRQDRDAIIDGLSASETAALVRKLKKRVEKWEKRAERQKRLLAEKDRELFQLQLRAGAVRLMLPGGTIGTMCSMYAAGGEETGDLAAVCAFTVKVKEVDYRVIECRAGDLMRPRDLY